MTSTSAGAAPGEAGGPGQNLGPGEASSTGHHAHPDHSLTGFVLFLASESLVFLAFFAGYAVLKNGALSWYPAGVDGLEWREPLRYTAVLLSSSGTIALAEHFLARGRLGLFRGFWLLTMAMGAVFLAGQVLEWRGLAFGFTDGVFANLFYLLTGFHGLHVAAGIVLMGVTLARSFTPSAGGGHKGLQAAGLFWHFVDVIWVVLFLLLYVWR